MMTVDKKAIQDLLDKIEPYSGKRRDYILKVLLLIAPNLEAGNEAEARRRVPSLLLSVQPRLTVDVFKSQMETIQQCILELDHYKDKRAVAAATLAAVRRAEYQAEAERCLAAAQMSQLNTEANDAYSADSYEKGRAIEQIEKMFWQRSLAFCERVVELFEERLGDSKES